MNSLFFENHALGIMNQFSDSIDSASQAIAEKRRCVAGIEVMINLAQKDISVALPQVSVILVVLMPGTNNAKDPSLLTNCPWEH